MEVPPSLKKWDTYRDLGENEKGLKGGPRKAQKMISYKWSDTVKMAVFWRAEILGKSTKKMVKLFWVRFKVNLGYKDE